MKTYLPLALLLLFGCQQEVIQNSEIQTLNSAKASSERTELALISNNQLPADGCEAHVQLDKPGATTPVRYKPSEKSLSVLEKALDSGNPNEPFWGQKEVKVKFYETGKQVDLHCGWGSKQSVPEIEILEITNR